MANSQLYYLRVASGPRPRSHAATNNNNNNNNNNSSSSSSSRVCRAASLLALGQACNISFRVWAFPIILPFRVSASSFGVWGVSTAASLPASRAAQRLCGPRPRPRTRHTGQIFTNRVSTYCLFTFFFASYPTNLIRSPALRKLRIPIHHREP